MKLKEIMKNKIFTTTIIALLLYSCSDLLSEKLVYGCTDSTACNYNDNANTDDNTCSYQEDYYDCDGNCISDGDNDKICDEIDPCIGNYYENTNFSCQDIHILQDFININPSLDSLDIFDLVEMTWCNDDGRLRYLSLSNRDLILVPENIGDLGDSAMTQLNLSNNRLVSIPETICNLPSSCEIFVQGNNLCEEYNFSCIDHWGEQDCND